MKCDHKQFVNLAGAPNVIQLTYSKRVAGTTPARIKLLAGYSPSAGTASVKFA